MDARIAESMKSTTESEKARVIMDGFTIQWERRKLNVSSISPTIRALSW